jgi:branched-chain amino acid transport system permease protein
MNRRQRIKSFSIVALIVFLFCLPLFLKNIYWLHILCLACINVLLASSLRTINLTGELSLGQVGFMLIGAYSSALLSMRMGVPVWLAMLLGGLLAAAVALVLGYPILRTKGVYFTVLTFLVAEIFRLGMWYTPSLSGGPAGLSSIPPPGAINILGITTLAFATKNAYYYLLLVIVLISLVILFRIERSLGFTWMSIRQNDSLAESVGINVMGYKLIAFVVGCFFAGIAGALFAHFMHLLTTDVTAMFGMLMSIYVVIYMVVGGQASFAGPIVGAVVLTLVPEFARPLKEYQPIIFGALVIFIIFFMRQGLIGLPYYLPLWWRKALGSLRKTPVTLPLSPVGRGRG